MVAPLVGNDVLLRKHRIGGSVLRDHVVEETEIQIHGRITGAIERTNGARRVPTGGRYRIREDLKVRKLVGHAGPLIGQLRLPDGVKRLCGRNHSTLDALVCILSCLTR